MCGIAGMLSLSASETKLRDGTEAMLSQLVHRGPDDKGLWLDKDRGLALGHRRLSILELSPLGHQPMHSAAKKFSIVFNGEIYNFKYLRVLLEKEFRHSFRGRSDTEVLLASFEHLGISSTLEKINGMFAIALWDHATQILHLMRDRMGEKPLIYGRIGQDFYFASEVRAIAKVPGLSLNIEREALAQMIRFNNVPAPLTIYSELHKLEPGKMLSLARADLAGGIIPKPVSYWSCREVFDGGEAQRGGRADEQTVVQELNELLLDATEMRLESDVPVGAFLSGGVDSSLTVALMQAKSSKPVRTFTVGFDDPKYNEAEFAKNIARHLGTDHTELHVSDADVLDAVPQMADVYDEPFSDSSQVPTYLISRLTRKHVTVSLSGDGGDELFAGYNRYAKTAQMWEKMNRIPAPIRHGGAAALKVFPPAFYTNSFGSAARVFAAARRGTALGFKVHKFAGMLDSSNLPELYVQMISQWQGSDSPLGTEDSLPPIFKHPEDRPHDPDIYRQMMFLDCAHYLPDEILVKVDRAAMASSLETRIPLLDHRVVEFSSRQPIELHRHDGRGKYLLRRLLNRYVPLELFDRPKMGFNAPIQHWLRGPLRDWAEDLIAQDFLIRDGIFDPKPIRKKWAQHLRGQDGSWELWSILMFQSWLRRNRQ